VLTGSYVVFTLMIALIGFLLLYFSSYFTSDDFKKAHEINEYSELLATGKYDRVPYDMAFPDNTSIEIFDSKMNRVWTNGKSTEVGYTDAEVACMPVYHKYVYASATEYKVPYGGKCELVTRYYNNSDYTDPEDEFMLLDVSEPGYIWLIYGSVDIGRFELTPSEFSYLAQQVRNGRYYSRLEFVSATGADMTMVIGVPEDSTYDDTYDEYMETAVVVFIALYVIVAALSIMWIDRKVKKPLGMLENAIQEFSKGERGGTIEYSGPREFENICDSFNTMSERVSEGERQREAMEADKRRMLADISHDLRTPITVIQGYAGALKDGVVPPEREQEYLEAIYRKSQVMTELVNTFYEYSKTDSPDFRLTLERVDICEFMREYLADKYTELDMAGFTLDVDIPEEPIFCMIDKVQFRRAVENLVTNSVKHNQAGAALFIAVRCEDGKVKLTVSDNGEGVPEGIAQTLFEPFVMGDDSRSNKGGSGLGLSICRRIVEAHEGSIRLVDPPQLGSGAEFEIAIPEIK